MEYQVFWLEQPAHPRLGIMPCPLGGKKLEDEVALLKRQGTDVLASMLTEEEAREFELEDEADCCARNAIEFVSYPVPDHEVPADYEAFASFVKLLSDRLAEGKSVAIHCFAGIGRSGLAASCVLVAQGMSPEEAIRVLSSARGVSIPYTDEQENYIADFAARYRKDTDP